MLFFKDLSLFRNNSPFVKKEIVKIRKITLSDKFVHSFISRETKNLSSPSVPRSILFLTAERKIKINGKEGVPLLEFSFSQIASVFSVYSFPKKWKEWIEKKVATRNVVHGWNRFDTCRAPNPRVIYPRLRNKFVINRFVYLFVVFSFPFLFLFFRLHHGVKTIVCDRAFVRK